MTKHPKKSPAPKFSWLDLMKAFYFLLDKKRKSYFIYTTILVLVLFYDMVPIFIVGKIIDFFTKYSPGDSLNVFYYYVIFITVTYGAISLIRLTIKKRLANIRSNVTYFTRVKGFERLLEFSVGWHDKENTGNKVQRIQAGTETLRQMQDILSQDVFRQITGIIGVLTIFLLLGPVFFIFGLIYISIFIVIQMSFYKRMVEMNAANNILMEKAGGTYYEGLSNVLTIKTLGVKDSFKTSVISKEAMTRDQSIRKVTMMNDKWKFFQVVNACSIGGILLLNGMNFISGAISLGSIFVIYNYFQRLNDSVSTSTNTVEKLIEFKTSIGRMMPIFWDDTLVKQGRLLFPKDWKNINIEDASFKYPKILKEGDASEVKETGLENISLKINRNQKVGIVGKSGSGKSTLAKIFLGLYEFKKGKFTIGGTKFKDIKHDEITREIALVLQDSEMFNLSLKENITLMRTYDEALFQKSISISQLTDVIEKLPDGVDTLIGEKGYRLSGGERQRIGIARAIYKDPQILVLDEATSSLDSKTEALIQKAFEENLTKKTVISIAHRISTLKNVDKIVVVDDGKIVEEGTFKDLSEDAASRFYELYQSQQNSGNEDSI